MEGKIMGIPKEIFTILAIDAVVIGLYSAKLLAEKKHLIGAKVLGTTVLVGTALMG